MIIVTVARRPLDASNVASNVIEHGAGALNIDGCRVATTDDCSRVATRTNMAHVGFVRGVQVARGHEAGRWPANLVLSEGAAEHLDTSRFFHVVRK